jgi:small-conductance mechanosensitive channel
MSEASVLLTEILTTIRTFDGVAITGLRIVAIVVVGWLAIMAAQRAIRHLRVRISSHFVNGEAVKRAETLGRVFRYIATVIISLLTGTLILSEVGVSIAPILGAAGVVGLAVGFGAQSLVKDYFTGFFLLVEDQIRQGDVVELGNHSGLVEEVTLRYVQLRDYSGHVHFVPNGSITSVVNMGRGYAQAVIDVGVAYSTNLDVAMAVMKTVSSSMLADPLYSKRILDHLEMAGVERWADSSIIIRARIRVAPLEQWNVRREYLRRLKDAFDREGIEIPFPHVTLHQHGPRADMQRVNIGSENADARSAMQTTG